VWHPEGHLYGIAPDGQSVVDRDAPAFFEGVARRGNSEHLAEHDRIVKIDTAGPRCAVAKVQIALPPAPASPTPTHTDVLYTDFLVLLRLGGRWRIVSKVFSAAPLAQSSYHEPSAPAVACAEPAEGVVAYLRGGHLSQPQVMAESWHEVARLLYADDGGELVLCSRDAFFERVRARAVTAEDPAALQFDKVVSVDKAGADVALVKLQIGYPPILYTDVLSMLRLGSRWWIVAKSSDCEPFRAA